jgi:hypothetical protein
MFSEFFTAADVSAKADTIPIALVVFALATLHVLFSSATDPDPEGAKIFGRPCS